MHNNSLIKKLINNQDHTTHVVDKRLALNVVTEDVIEALVDTVEDEPENQLVVFAVAYDKNSHVRILAEDGHIVVDSHDVVFKRVYTAGCSTTTCALLA